MSSQETPAPDSILLPPCVAAFRYKMNRGNAITVGSQENEPGQLGPYAACSGKSDPWCVGGSIEWPPDPMTQQDEFAMAMAGICTARCWFARTNSGVTVAVEKLGD